MKKRYILLLVLSFITLSPATGLFAQMVGDNVFLQGRYVEIGIAPNGGYGSTFSAPAGYHPNLGTTFTFWDPGASTSTTSSTLLGFVADYGADGWGVGTPPYFGDFYMPGHPQEGWAIQVGGVESHAYIPIYLTTGTTGFTGTLAGTNTSYTNSGGIIKGIWQGTAGALAIRQTTTLDTNKLYFTVQVVLTNTGSTPLPDIYYIRTLDPDNDETRSSDYTTVNTISFQLPSPGNKVLVSTTGFVYTAAYLGLGTKDCRAKCMIFDGGLDPGYPLDQMWNETTPYIYAQGTGSTSDVGIALDYKLGTLAPGDSTSLTYAYILNASYIDSALNATLPGFTVNGVHRDSTDTIDLCSYAPDSINVNILNGGFYSWRWSPDSFLAHPSGTSTVIHSDSITADIVYTITGTNTAGGCDSIVYHLVLNHETFSPAPLPPVYYCQYDAAVPLTAPGTGLLWYTSGTGGVGSPVAPTPSTLFPGTTIYWVTETVGLCQSLRNPDTVIVKPLPPPPFITNPTPYCWAQPFVPFTVTGTGVLWYNSATGGTGSVTSPTVNTFIPGNDTVWASQTVNGCEGPRARFVVTVLNELIPGYTFVPHLGCNGDTVVFTNTSIGAARYLWDFGDGVSDTFTSPVHIYYTQGTYNVKMIAINAQCADSVTLPVPLIHPLKAGFDFSPAIICQKESVTFTDTSVGSGLTYAWSFGNGATDNAQNTANTYNNVGVYQVQLVVTDFVPCKDTAYGTVYVDSISEIKISVTDTTMCRSAHATFTGDFTSIGNTGVTWHFGDGDTIKGVNPVAHAFDITGVFTVSVTALYRACPTIETTRTIYVYPAPGVYIGDDTTICPGSQALVIGDQSQSSNPGATYKWNTGQTTPTITVVAPGKYVLNVNIDGCYGTDSVNVANDCYMNIPNVFSPNADGLNDYFFPREYLTRGLQTFKMEIYNRWGQLIFETSSITGAGWDGKFNDAAQPVGVYIYSIDATFKDGQKEHHQGNVTLLR